VVLKTILPTVQINLHPSDCGWMEESLSKMNLVYMLAILMLVRILTDSSQRSDFGGTPFDDLLQTT
jgi:hypothetical protein